MSGIPAERYGARLAAARVEARRRASTCCASASVRTCAT